MKFKWRVLLIFYLKKLQKLLVDFLYILLFIAFLGDITYPEPLVPYVGLIELLTFLLTDPVVFDLKTFLTLGFRTPNFIHIPPCI